MGSDCLSTVTTHTRRMTVTVSAVIVGVSLVALASGILFAKFSVPTARMVFADWATISPLDGVPTLMFRIGNERASQVIEATVGSAGSGCVALHSWHRSVAIGAIFS